MAQNQLFATKSLEQVLREEAGDHRLKRVLGPWALTALGVGAVIGAGIFVATGKAANETAGPALMVSYMFAGLTCIFAALCYAEFASMAPVAGSAYTYSYTTLGELFAWIIGWDLVLEYAVGAATVANGWSSYFKKLLPETLAIPLIVAGGPYKYDNGHLLPNSEARFDNRVVVTQKAIKLFDLEQAIKDNKIPAAYRADAEAALAEATAKNQREVVSWIDKKAEAYLGRVGDPAVESKLSGHQQAFIDLPAVIITFIITIILVRGIQESALFNAVMVFIKVAAVVFVILVGMWYINGANYDPFAPYGWGGMTIFGTPVGGTQTDAAGNPLGMIAGASIIFFAYIGFDAVSTQAEEAKNPQKDVPFGIITSLIICTILYIAVVAVLTGMVKYSAIDKSAGVSVAFANIGLPWASLIIAAAGVAGITSVLLVMMMSAPRVFLAMARDGLLPRGFFGDVHPRYKTPWKGTIAVGLAVALGAGFLPIDSLLHMTNIGTLFAFVIVCAAVIVMRNINPTANRPFRCPLVPIVPGLGILLCLTMMFSLPVENWYRLFGWLGIGLVIYFIYGKQHSNLGRAMRGQPAA
jgi:APA family basic amino acid/polyamine antiporter